MHQDDPSPSNDSVRRFDEEEGLPRRLLIRRAVVFVLTAGLLIFLALDGAAYDLLVRQEVGLGIWAAIAIGFALGLLPRGLPDKVLIVPLLGAVALIAWMLASLLWSDSAERTTAEVARVLVYLGLATLAVSGLNRHTFRAAAAGLSTAALAIAALSVTTRLYPSLIPSANDLTAAFGGDRLNYPLDYWNAVGIWGAMAVAIGLAWSAHARFAVVRALALAAVPVAALAVYLSYSRGGVIGTAVAAVAVLALSINRWTAFVHLIAAAGGAALAILAVRGNDEIARAAGGAGGDSVLLALGGGAVICAAVVLITFYFDLDRVRLPRRTARWAVPSFVCLLLVGTVVFGHEPISRAWDQFSHTDQPAAGPDPAARLTSAGGGRIHLWDSALDAFQEHPVQGIGAGTYEYWWTQNGDGREFVRDAHSLYLEQLAELGLPGLLLLLILLGGLTAAALQARAGWSEDGDFGAGAALIAAFLVFAVTAGGDWMWEETAVGALAIGGLAVAAAGGSERLRRERRWGPIPRPGVRAAIIIVAIAAALFEIPGIVATDRIRASESAARDGDLSEARDLAESAVDAQPWAASPHLQLALVLAADGRPRDARRSAETAAQKEPTNWRIPPVLARLDRQLGNHRAARRDLRRARQLWPRSPFLGPPAP